MPLTAAERQRKYREKLKIENPEKYENIKKKVAENAKLYYRKRANEYTEEEKENRRKKWREERNIQRQSKKDEEVIEQKTISTDNKRFQMHMEYRLRKENQEFRKEIAILRKGMAALKMKYFRQSQKLDKLNKEFLTTVKKIEESKQSQNLEINSADQTPGKQTETFLNENLPNIDATQKEKIKKKILEYNVLTESLKKEYAESVRKDKNTLKRIVTNEIVGKYKLKTRLKSTLGLKSNIKRNRDRKIMKNQRLNEIRQFYDRDDNSRATAGKKEFKTKQKVKLQRRYLLDTIKKLHKKYKAEGGKASLATFQKYRPFYVLKPKISDRDTCACVKHANMAFKLKTLKQLRVLESEDLSDVIAKLVCDTSSQDCMYGLCESCKDNVINAGESQVNCDEKHVWLEWKLQNHEYGELENKKNTKKMVKTQREGSVHDLINATNSDMKQFLIHSYNISHQYKSYKGCITNLKPNETVIHVDFSENYVCKLHTEVQAMHFGSSKVQITLHTGVFYIKSESDHKPTSFCTISPENKHSPEAIWAHLAPILQYIKTTYPQIDTLHFYSDGPTSQYRNKKNFYLLTQIQDYGFNHATWSFFEAAHGKGAADGVGGAIKRNLDSNVAHGADISDAKAAFDILSKSETSIKIFYIPPEDIKPIAEEIVNNLRPLPNTLKIHQVIFNEKNSVNFRYLSCFCRNMSGKCDCYAPKSHKFEISQTKIASRKNKQTLKKTNKVGKMKMRRNSSSSISSTDSESIEIEYLDDSDASHFSEIDYLEELDSDENIHKETQGSVDKDLEELDSDENIHKETQGSVVKDLEERGSKETTDENTNHPNRAQKKSKTATRKGVTVLSEVRGTVWNIKYSDLKKIDELQLKDISLNFDLHMGKESSDCARTKENIDPYKNPVASVSGVNKKRKLEEQDCPKTKENIDPYKDPVANASGFDKKTKLEKPDCASTKENIDPYKDPVASVSGFNKKRKLEKPDCARTKENIDPYKDPVASVSGFNKKRKIEKLDCARTKENIDPYKDPEARISEVNKRSNLEKPGALYHISSESKKQKVQLHNKNEKTENIYGDKNQKSQCVVKSNENTDKTVYYNENLSYKGDVDVKQMENIRSIVEVNQSEKTENIVRINEKTEVNLEVKNNEHTKKTECIVDVNESNDEIENSIENVNYKDVIDITKFEKIQSIVEVNQSENTENMLRVNEKTEESLEVQENGHTRQRDYSISYQRSITTSQSVLVRYYMRKKWKYYIGWVEAINTNEDDAIYTINFLKTVKKPTLKFVVPKKIDRDNVPSNSIVKTIELHTSDKKNEYQLKNDFDSTYFDL